MKTSAILPSHTIVQSCIINIHVHKNVSAYSVSFFRWLPIHVLDATTLEMVKRLLLASVSWTLSSLACSIVHVFTARQRNLFHCLILILLFCAELTGRAKVFVYLLIYLFPKLEQLPVMYNFNSRKSISHPTLHWLCQSTKPSLKVVAFNFSLMYNSMQHVSECDMPLLV